MRYITPQHCIDSRLDGRPRPDWAAALLVFRDRKHSQKVLDAFAPVRPVQYRMLYNLTGTDVDNTVFEADVAGRTVAIVTRCVWGGPQTAILVEELACLGVPMILGYGVAGSLDPDLPQGAFVVAESVVTTDGTSRAYGADGDAAGDADLLRTVAGRSRDLGHPTQVVTAATVDALYQETPELVAGLRGQGAQIVNLETSPLYVVAAHCGVRAVWFGYISDVVDGDAWHDWFADLGTAGDDAAQLCRAAIEAALSE